jgi:hypothetical protein
MSCKWLIAMWLMLFAFSAYPQKKKALPNLTYSELIRNKEEYLNKTVRLRAIWNYGYEWTYLCDSECKDLQKSWVDMLDDDDLCRGSKSKLKKMNKRFDNGAEVVVQGKLEEGNGFGHFGIYRFQFVISCVEVFKTHQFR